MTRSARAAVFHGPGLPFEIRELEVKDPTGGEVLVRVTGCTLCGSDLHTVEGRRSAPMPSILGHEIIGAVEGFGPDAPRIDAAGRDLRAGDRVTWSVVASCGVCFYCGRGLPQKCTSMVKYGHEALRDGREPSGGLADSCRLAPGSTILRLPDAMPDAVACPASCATATVAAVLRAAGAIDGRSVLVQGAGMLGLTACAMARDAGAAEVICTDPDPARLARSGAFGATRTSTPGDLATTVHAATSGYGVDAALELSGSPEAFESGLPLLRIGGTYVLAGAVFPARPVPLLMEQVVRGMATLRGVHNYAPEDLIRAVEFLKRAGDDPFEGLVAEWFPLDQVEAAFRKAREPGVFRVGVRG